VLRAAVAVVRFQDQDRAIGRVAVIEVVNGAIPRTLTLALESLDVASRDLDDAMVALPNFRGDDVMASSSLVGLLFRVVAARHQVRELALDLKAEIKDRVGASTVS
jgi:hypothetical protein